MGHDGLTTWGAPLKLRELSASREHPFRLVPTSEACEELAASLGLSALKKVSFTGKLVPLGKSDWRLEATLGASVVQPCVATLVPVTTRLDVPVERSYLTEYENTFEEGGEEEMPEDDTAEPLPSVLLLSQVAEEALALSAPDYPRADGADLGVTRFTEPGKEAMSDEDAKPFAALKALREKLENKDD